MGLFEVDETNGINMVLQFESLLSKFGLMHHVIAFMKDESNNLSTMATTLLSIIICQPLKLNQVYEGTCFGHVMSKVCQYDNKVYKGLMQVDVKDAQAILQKTITRTKKSSKGRQEWEKVCIECGLLFRKLKTLVKTRFSFKVIMFEKTLEFKQAIITCYERQKTIVLQQKVPKAQVWAIVATIISTCGNNLCYELVPWSLVSVKCFDYYHYLNCQLAI